MSGLSRLIDLFYARIPVSFEVGISREEGVRRLTKLVETRRLRRFARSGLVGHASSASVVLGYQRSLQVWPTLLFRGRFDENGDREVLTGHFAPPRYFKWLMTYAYGFLLVVWGILLVSFFSGKEDGANALWGVVVPVLMLGMCVCFSQFVKWLGRRDAAEVSRLIREVLPQSRVD